VSRSSEMASLVGRALAGVALVVAVGSLASTPAAATRRPADADEGGALYARHCQACHGALGRGDGPVAADLVGGVPDLGGSFARRDVEAAMPTVLSGRGAMPAFAEVIDTYQARRVLRHLATLASQPPPSDSSTEPARPPEPSAPDSEREPPAQEAP